MPGYQTTLVEAQSDGTAVTGTAEGTLLAGTAARIAIPSGMLYRAGKRLHILATGRISNIVTTPGTLTMRFKLGPTANIAVAQSSAWQLNAVAKTNVGWALDLTLTLRTIGSGTTAAFIGNGTWSSESVVGSPVPSAGGAGTHMWAQSAPAVGTGFDTTVDNTLDLTAQFSLTGNSIQVHTFAVEDLTFTP